MKRANVGFHTVLKRGFGNQNTGSKRPQGHAQTRQLGYPRQAQRDEQKVQHEQLVALAQHDQTQPIAHGIRPNGQ